MKKHFKEQNLPGNSTSEAINAVKPPKKQPKLSSFVIGTSKEAAIQLFDLYLRGVEFTTQWKAFHSATLCGKFDQVTQFLLVNDLVENYC